MLYQPGVTVDDLSLDDEQRQAAQQITEADGCVHALWSAAGGGKSYILAVLLAAWARIAGQTALAIYVTSRKKHRDPILKLLRDKLSKEEVWINAGDSEVQDKENHLMAGVGASSDIALARALNRLQELDEKIDAVGPKEPAALALHAERVQVLFVNILWKRHEQMQAMLTGTKIMVMTADLARKTLSKTPVWARNRQLQVLIHDEIENSSFTEFISLAAHFDFVITAGDKPQRLEQAKNTYRGMPGHDPEERQTGTAQSLPSSALPLYPIYTTATDFLVPHANNVRLHTVRRWGQTIGDLLHQLGEERVTCRCSHDTVLHKIQLSGSLWEDVGLRSGVTCVFGRTLFTLITSVAKAWLQQRMTVGIIVLYRHSVNVLETWRSGLQEEEQARIAVGTPETVQGDTFPQGDLSQSPKKEARRDCSRWTQHARRKETGGLDTCQPRTTHFGWSHGALCQQPHKPVSKPFWWKCLSWPCWGKCPIVSGARPSRTNTSIVSLARSRTFSRTHKNGSSRVYAEAFRVAGSLDTNGMATAQQTNSSCASSQRRQWRKCNSAADPHAAYGILWANIYFHAFEVCSAPSGIASWQSRHKCYPWRPHAEVRRQQLFLQVFHAPPQIEVWRVRRRCVLLCPGLQHAQGCTCSREWIRQGSLESLPRNGNRIAARWSCQPCPHCQRHACAECFLGSSGDRIWMWRGLALC